MFVCFSFLVEIVTKISNFHFIYWALIVLSETLPAMTLVCDMKKLKICRRVEPNISLERSRSGE